MTPIEPRYYLDLNQHHWRHTYGDISVFGTWVGKDRSPALVLINTHRLGYEDAVPCIVPLASAWKWGDHGDPRHVAHCSVLFASNLGLAAHNPATCMRVVCAVRDNIDRLLSIPPKPTETFVAADIMLTDSDGRERHVEMIERV